jgi:hypothetical protein
MNDIHALLEQLKAMQIAQIEEWFRYHDPTPETEPKYARIREMQEEIPKILHQAFSKIRAHDAPPKASMHNLVNEQTKQFALLILELCPEGEDRRAAIEHVRMARHAFNEFIAVTNSNFDGQHYASLGEIELVKARWKANNAIACAPSLTPKPPPAPPPTKTPYGFCPVCGAPGIRRERRPNGNDFCENGHGYLSSQAKNRA